MDVPPLIQETKEEEISEIFYIKQGDKQYKLNLQINDQKSAFFSCRIFHLCIIF